MKKNNRKKGFTLIELLAVIVVLAIVSVLGASLILPALANARKDAFVTEANNFLEAASNGINMIQVGTITNKELEDVNKDGEGNTIKNYNVKDGENGQKVYCFTLEGLIRLGLFNKKTGADGKVEGYNGKVEVTINSGSKLYQYQTTFSNKDYYVKEIIGNIKESNVIEYKSGEKFSTEALGLSDKCN